MRKLLLQRWLFLLWALFIAGITYVQASELSAMKLAFDDKGFLWRLDIQQQMLQLRYSNDLGQTFSKPVSQVIAHQPIVTTIGSRPDIAVGPNGKLFLTWTEKHRQQLIGKVWFSMSGDGGESFSEPKVVSHSYQNAGYSRIVVTDSGAVVLLWSASENADETSENALFYAYSSDSGKSFEIPKLVANRIGSCANASVINKANIPVVIWGNEFNKLADYMMAEIPLSMQEVSPKRVSFKKWKTDHCDAYQSALAVGGESEDWWGYHVAYFAGKDKKPGLYYTRIDGEAWVAFPAKQFGSHADHARHPALMSQGQQVWLAWLETASDGTKSVMIKRSHDEGKSWGDEQAILLVKGKIDYPQLLKDKDNAYLAVNTANGLKVILIE